MSIELAQSRVSKHAVGRRPAAVSEGLKMLQDTQWLEPQDQG